MTAINIGPLVHARLPRWNHWRIGLSPREKCAFAPGRIKYADVGSVIGEG
jgi:hypothetical protein